ncbi:hypothetical protein KHC23_04720 [Ancylobacter dichloromethanicus]|uniref:Uncharacterized protein n=1 Tax=Ancylobacter dichloromethanicus TaxID=518825 RepID=A0A9W6N165_9HYPH|nr:hypothetical protein [Ancylobacter dichloromethanicus]MBS7552953.1 hypothetical protein [Ancylobacter dichloromethanicus]GLK74559.1 hypothetical protein GCM10017643_46770 [Ancylobacter dichloromethanicus]
MKKTFAILFASTALTAGIGIPAWSAMHDTGRFGGLRDAVLDAGRDVGAMLVSDDDDDDHDRGRQRGGDDDEDDDDDDARGGSVSAPVPAGSVAPPNNGLFGNGAAPKAQVN